MLCDACVLLLINGRILKDRERTIVCIHHGGRVRACSNSSSILLASLVREESTPLSFFLSWRETVLFHVCWMFRVPTLMFLVDLVDTYICRSRDTTLIHGIGQHTRVRVGAYAASTRSHPFRRKKPCIIVPFLHGSWGLRVLARSRCVCWKNHTLGAR